MGRPNGKHLTDEERRLIVEKVDYHESIGETATDAARALGMRAMTVRRIAKEARAALDVPIEFPDFVEQGDDDEPISELIARRKRGFERREKAARERKWFPIKIGETLPYGILWFGDPHIDDNACNWPLLQSHLDIAKRPGIYGANIGDTTNNWPWTGRMARLWAEQEVTDREGKRLAEWFMFESGVTWLLWLLGNHDEWNGGSEFYKRLGAFFVPVIDWRAQFTLVHQNGSETRVDASHGRKGNSIYNPSHGTLRAAKFGEDADLFVTGHIHSYKLDHFEIADRGSVSWLAQVRGYKWFDHYADVHGFAPHQLGAAVLSVHDPVDGSVVCFGDPEQGADFLAYKRRKAA